MDLGIRKIIKNKSIKNYIINEVQLTETLYAVLVFEKGNDKPRFSSCVEISKHGLNCVISGERRLLNKIYRETINKLMVEDYSFFN